MIRSQGSAGKANQAELEFNRRPRKHSLPSRIRSLITAPNSRYLSEHAEQYIGNFRICVGYFIFGALICLTHDPVRAWGVHRPPLGWVMDECMPSTPRDTPKGKEAWRVSTSSSPSSPLPSNGSTQLKAGTEMEVYLPPPRQLARSPSGSITLIHPPEFETPLSELVGSQR